MAVTRQQLLDTPRSGARPLFGDDAPGRAEPRPAARGDRQVVRARQAGDPRAARAMKARKARVYTAPPPKPPKGVKTAAQYAAKRAAPQSASPPAPVPAAAAAQPPAAAPASATTSSSPGRVATVTSQGGGLVLALVLYPFGVNLLKGGPARAWAWVKAKWVNQPLGGAGAAAPAGSGGSTSVFAGKGGPQGTPTSSASLPEGTVAGQHGR